MPVVLPGSMLTEAERPIGQSPWIWFCELEVQRRTKTLPPVVFRMTSYHEPLQWPNALSSPPKETWFPYPFEQGEIEETGEGDLPRIDLSVDNSNRLLMQYLHAGDGCEGNSCKLYLANEAGLAAAYPPGEFQTWQFRVASAVASDTVVTFQLEEPNFNDVRVPTSRFVAKKCRWAFGSVECGYPINSVAAYAACNHTVADCVARGQDEAVRRLPVLHPRRFGGFPGIRVRRGGV